jgi:hypothetical protein
MVTVRLEIGRWPHTMTVLWHFDPLGPQAPRQEPEQCARPPYIFYRHSDFRDVWNVSLCKP